MKYNKIVVFLCIIFLAFPSNIYGDTKYFKNQLNSESKFYYDDMFNNFYKNALSNPIVYDINKVFENTYLNDEITSYLLKYRLAYSALYLDCPQYYWNKNVKISYAGSDYYNIELNQLTANLKNISIYINSGSYSSKTSRNKLNKAYKKAIKKINKIRGKKAGKVKTIKAINSFLKSNTKYYYTKGSLPFYSHNVYGTFVKKKAVCDGYSKAFKMLCDYYNIPCVIELGYVKNKGKKIGHAWNLVKVKNKWYYVDATWNDTQKTNKYLLMGSKEFNKKHIHDKKRMDVIKKGYFKLPKASKKKYPR